MIHNAPAHLPYPSATVPGTLTPIRGADEDDWWEIFEVNVRSIQSVARHFFTKMREGAVFINVLPGVSERAGTGTAAGDVGLEKGMAAWDASGVAAERVIRYLAEENGKFGCFGVHVRQDGDVSEEGVGKVVGLLGS